MVSNGYYFSVEIILLVKFVQSSQEELIFVHNLLNIVQNCIPFFGRHLFSFNLSAIIRQFCMQLML